MTAEERRAELVDAAVEEFAQAGLAGASTEAIARRAGISHAYLFRLYPTKRALFAATVDDAFDHVLRTFQEAYAARTRPSPCSGSSAMPTSRSSRTAAACSSSCTPTRRAATRTSAPTCASATRPSAPGSARSPAASEDDIRVFMSTGLLLAVGAAIDAPDLAGDGSFMLRALDSQPSG